jgi:hypothetical protein
MIVPVIHCIDWDQIKHNLDICQRNGVEMVFLINHRPSEEAVRQLEFFFLKAKEEYPNIKIGLNFLQLKTEDCIVVCETIGADAIWTDYPGTWNDVSYDGDVSVDMVFDHSEIIKKSVQLN